MESAYFVYYLYSAVFVIYDYTRYVLLPYFYDFVFSNRYGVGSATVLRLPIPRLQRYRQLPPGGVYRVPHLSIRRS